MTKPFLFLLELIRIVIFLAIGFGLLGWVEQLLIYSPFKIQLEDYFLYYLLGNFLILFIFYRNVFQFQGWFKSKRNKKLPQILSILMSLVAVSLIILPIIARK
ncbi:hypothetical protein HQN89_07750 [Paenibacillus frigoriresistens]|uniref:hypothetical protein n=1 Tax=Paenibacillus alginolyticus TaxID=59839 RepID=UPI001565A536|nr:hypothetical protein [Paenibacillus frigoriresistens]NRF90912.1 hypothetical protein [Paenibacillus frigoriresistens]